MTSKPSKTSTTAGASSITEPSVLLGLLPDPVVVVDLSLRVLWVNRAAEERFGWASEEIRGTSGAELIHADDLACATVSLVSVQERGLGTPVEMRLRDAGGVYGRFEVRGRATPEGVVLVMRDLTDRRRWEVAGGDTQLLQAVIDSAPAATLLLDVEGRVRGASRALTSMLGHNVEHIIGTPLATLAAEEDLSAVAAELALAAAAPGTRSFETRFRRADGGAPVPMSVTVVNLDADRAIEGLVATAVDISALVEARALLEHLATRDPLTGLLSRTPLRDLLDDALSKPEEDATVALMFCDIDHFKAINDGYGHAAGDEVLVEVARRLSDLVRGSDTVARFGGDEFVIFVHGPQAADVAREVTERIHGAMGVPVRLSDGNLLTVGLSVGVATDAAGLGAEAALRAADAAMYAAKERRRSAADTVTATGVGGGEPQPARRSRLVEELLAIHGHRLLNRATTTAGVLEMLLGNDELGDDERRQLLGLGADSTSRIRDDLAEMIAGIVGDLASDAAGAAGATLRRRLHADGGSRLVDEDRRRPIHLVLRSRDALRVAYQPIVDLERRATVGHEALARFTGGRSPRDWFAEAHEVGLGIALEMAAVTLATRRHEGGGFLSLNVSVATLASSSLLDHLATRAAAMQIMLELSAADAAAHWQQLIVSMRPLRALGVGLAITGTGAPTAPTQHLTALAPQIVKLDRSLIAFLDGDPSRRSAVRSLVAMASSFGARVAAVGIEREEELRACLELGVSLGQGHLLGRPEVGPPHEALPFGG